MWPGDGNAGLEFECDEFDAEPEFWKKLGRAGASRCVPKPSDAKTSEIGGNRLAVWVAGI